MHKVQAVVASMTSHFAKKCIDLRDNLCIPTLTTKKHDGFERANGKKVINNRECMVISKDRTFFGGTSEIGVFSQTVLLRWILLRLHQL